MRLQQFLGSNLLENISLPIPKTKSEDFKDSKDCGVPEHPDHLSFPKRLLLGAEGD